MADETRGRDENGRGGYQRRQPGWRDRSEGGHRQRDDRGRGPGSYGGREDRYQRGEYRQNGEGYGHGDDDRGGDRYQRGRGGYQSGQRQDRGYRRDDRDGYRSGGDRRQRDDRFQRDGEHQGGGRYQRDGRGERRYDNADRGRGFRRDDRDGRGYDRGRDDQRGPNRFDRDGYRSGGDRRQRDDRFQRDGEHQGGGRYQRDGRGERRYDNADRGRGFRRDGRGYDRGRDDQRGPKRFDRDDRGDNRYSGGYQSGQRQDRGYRRDDRDGYRSGGDRRQRDDRFQRDGEHQGGGRYQRDGRGERRYDNADRGRGFRRDGRGYDRGLDDQRGPKRFDRDDRSGRGRLDDRSNQGYSSTSEFASRDGGPAIPAGVSPEELDPQALVALETLSGPNRDIVARHLVMAGQLIDLDPQEAYKHAQAAVARAGRVDVVREAAALTAYASGRYEEALREVRAVRRMRGDDSLRAVEADSERGLGHPEKAVEIVDAASTVGMELSEQVELVLVSSGARADLGQSDVGLVIVDDALARLGDGADETLVRRLMEVKADRLRELGRDDEADETLAAMPEEIEAPDIVDVSLYQDADVDSKRSPLRGTEAPLADLYDVALLDLDGTAWAGDQTIDHAADAVLASRERGMKSAFVTNNAMRTPQQVADKLNAMGFEATPDMVMTSAMDAAANMAEELEEGAKVFMIGGEGLRQALAENGFTVVASADDEPVAVVQGLDKQVDWSTLSEGAFAIQRGAAYYATNLDATLPEERGQALGNGALVRAIRHATGKRPVAAGKPEASIYQRGARRVGGERPLAVGDRLETDIMGAVNARVPAMHVLTGVHGAQDVLRAPRGQRPSFLARDMRGLLEAHPGPKHHRDGTWTCGFSQVAKATRSGALTLDDIELVDGQAVTIDSYRALAAAAWEYADEVGEPHCPRITVVDNDDPTGVVAPPEPQEDSGSETVGATASEEAQAESQEDSGSADGASPQDADSAAVVGAEPEADYDGAVGDGAEALSGAVGAGTDSAESAPAQDPAAPDRDSEEPAEEAGWPPADSDSTTGAPAGPDADADAAADPEDVAAAADSLPDPADQIPEFLPGEEELEALLAETSGMDEDGR